MKGDSSQAVGWAMSTAAGFGLASSLSLPSSARAAALLGVALSASAGGLAALLISRAHRGAGLGRAMLAIAVPFAVRVVLVVAGLLVVARADQALPFVGAFFAVFFTQLLLEIFQVLSRQSRQRTAVPES